MVLFGVHRSENELITPMHARTSLPVRHLPTTTIFMISGVTCRTNYVSMTHSDKTCAHSNPDCLQSFAAAATPKKSSLTSGVTFRPNFGMFPIDHKPRRNIILVNIRTFFFFLLFSFIRYNIQSVPKYEYLIEDVVFTWYVRWNESPSGNITLTWCFFFFF